MGFKIVVDWELCEANAVCVKTAPDMFLIDDAEQLQILVENPSTPEQVELAQRAARRCPRRALTVVET